MPDPAAACKPEIAGRSRLFCAATPARGIPDVQPRRFGSAIVVHIDGSTAEARLGTVALGRNLHFLRAFQHLSRVLALKRNLDSARSGAV